MSLRVGRVVAVGVGNKLKVAVTRMSLNRNVMKVR